MALLPGQRIFYRTLLALGGLTALVLGGQMAWTAHLEARYRAGLAQLEARGIETSGLRPAPPARLVQVRMLDREEPAVALARLEELLDDPWLREQRAHARLVDLELFRPNVVQRLTAYLLEAPLDYGETLRALAATAELLFWFERAPEGLGKLRRDARGQTITLHDFHVHRALWERWCSRAGAAIVAGAVRPADLLAALEARGPLDGPALRERWAVLTWAKGMADDGWPENYPRHPAAAFARAEVLRTHALPLLEGYLGVLRHPSSHPPRGLDLFFERRAAVGAVLREEAADPPACAERLAGLFAAPPSAR